MWARYTRFNGSGVSVEAQAQRRRDDPHRAAADIPCRAEFLAQCGIFALTGEQLRLLQGRSLELEPGVFAFSGGDIDIEYGHVIKLDAGIFVLTGQGIGIIPTTTTVFPMTAVYRFVPELWAPVDMRAEMTARRILRSELTAVLNIEADKGVR